MLARPVTHIATAAVILSTAGAVCAGGAGTALAPEPVRLTADLTAAAGGSAVAVYINSAAPAKAVLWPSTLTAGSVPAGTPCSNVPLTNGQITTKVIQAVGSLRKCV